MTNRYDAIIVLGGGVDEQGNIPPNVGLRVSAATKLLKDGLAPRIIMSGKWGYSITYAPPCTEAAAMKASAVEQGANPDAILVEETSMDSVGNAYFCKVQLLAPNNWHRVLIATADHHIERAKYLFHKILGPDYTIAMYPVAVALTDEVRAQRAEHHAKSLALAHEFLDPITDGDDAAIWKLLVTKHPAYAENPKVSKEELLSKLGPQ